jgi:hypothetical protein
MKQNMRGEYANKIRASPRVPVMLRLPEDVVRRIDEELNGRDVPLSRNNWFLEAVIEKLRRNRSGEQNGA